MEYSIQKLAKSSVEISISIEKEEWTNYIQEAYNKNKFRYTLEGFRKGKVPFNVLVKRYGVEVFFEDAMDIAMSKTYGEVLQKEKLDPVSRPEVDVNVVDADGLKFTVGVALYPEFEVAPYTGLTFKKGTVYDYTTADTCTKGYNDNVIVALTGTKALFT